MYPFYPYYICVSQSGFYTYHIFKTSIHVLHVFANLHHSDTALIYGAVYNQGQHIYYFVIKYIHSNHTV